MYERIRYLRELNRLYQKQVAEYLNLTQQNYSRYETGDLEPSIPVLIKLARFYEVSIDYLVGVSDVKKQHWNEDTLNSDSAKSDLELKIKILNTPLRRRGRKRINL